ncbi:MAG: radical SAM protein [Lachnospiraceae bacterium]|nr:radical SAM protein [Lachnospiraceae bacterium]
MSGRYVCLKNRFCLRGWKKLPYALEDKESGDVAFMMPGEFHTLKFCNGRFTEDSPMFGTEGRKHLEFLEKQGIIEFTDEPGKLEKDQEYFCYDNRFIRQIHWSMTGHCNYKCRHCYMSAPHAVLPDLDTDTCRKIIDDIASCGIRHLSLTGGEVLIRRDFFELLDYMLEKDLKIVTIMSNGALVTEELLKELEKRNCKPEFNMSYDGTEGWHDWLRGVEGADEAVQRAFRLCKEHGFPTGSEMCLHKGNLHTLRDSVKLLGSLGVSRLKVCRLSCEGEGVALKDKELSVEEEYEAYISYIPQYIEDGMPLKELMLADVFLAVDEGFAIPMEHYSEEEVCEDCYICLAARQTMYLGPDGRILPCVPMSETDYSQERFPLISELSIKEALEDSSYINFIRVDLKEYREHNPGCGICEYKNRCAAGCRGRAVLHNNGADLLGIDPESCLFYKGGYYDRTKKLIEKYREIIFEKT